METESSKAKGFDFGPVIDFLKGIGVVAGSLGSLAALFFWIGNAIIVARLRAYNLYGVVHYTDEYVKEAGYQFFQDIFTFFQRWELILLFILATCLILLLIPAGPFSPASKKDIHSNRRIIQEALSFVFRMRAKGVHYYLFLGLAIFTSISLTSDLGVKNLSKNILRYERTLKEISDIATNNRLSFIMKRKDTVHDDEFQKRFYKEKIAAEEPSFVPSFVWLRQTLREAYPLDSEAYPLDSRDNAVSPNEEFLKKQIGNFQEELKISESPDVIFKDDFKNTRTYRTLLDIRMSKKLKEMILNNTKSTELCLWLHLSRYLTYKEDFSSLVVNPANYEKVNEHIRDTITPI